MHAVPAAKPAELRCQAAIALATEELSTKLALVAELSTEAPVDPTVQLDARMGRPAKPALVHPRRVPARHVGDSVGRGMLIHALAHIEFNAINLALDAAVRFADMPEQFYRDWVSVAKDEALHHGLLSQHIATLGVAYGDYPAHDGLWQMAEKTHHSLIARMALVPRLLEARGLDVSPGIRDKLLAVGDHAGAQVLQRILDDEIGHVAIGNRWFGWLCQQQGCDPLSMFEQALREYQAPFPRSPFNYPARAEAGFTEDEMAWLRQIEVEQTS